MAEAEDLMLLQMPGSPAFVQIFKVVVVARLINTCQTRKGSLKASNSPDVFQIFFGQKLNKPISAFMKN